MPKISHFPSSVFDSVNFPRNQVLWYNLLQPNFSFPTESKTCLPLSLCFPCKTIQSFHINQPDTLYPGKNTPATFNKIKRVVKHKSDVVPGIKSKLLPMSEQPFVQAGPLNQQTYHVITSIITKMLKIL